MAEIIKTLSDPDKILHKLFSTSESRAESELNNIQVEAVNKLRTLAGLFGSDLLDSHLDDFLVLQKSLNRQSRAEFVESLKNKKLEAMEKSDKKLALFG